MLTLIVLVSFIGNTSYGKEFGVIGKAGKPNYIFPNSEKWNYEEAHEGLITMVTENTLYSDVVPPNNSKRYGIRAIEESILTVFVSTFPNGTGLDVEVEGPVDDLIIQIFYVDHYMYYVREASDLIVVLTNSHEAFLNLDFFVDISKPLMPNQTKSIPVEESLVSFHAYLKKDDEVKLYSNPSQNLQLEMKAYALYFEVPPGSYQIYAYAEDSKSLHFTADLEGRYYILVKSIFGSGRFTLTSSIRPSVLSNELFWSAIGILCSAIISPFFITRIKKLRRREKEAMYTTGSYFSFLAIALFSSFLGAYVYQTMVWKILLYSSLVLFGSALGTGIYAAYLDRNEQYTICEHCGKRVDFHKQAYCCDRRVKNISVFWYLTPLVFTVLFALASFETFISNLDIQEFYLAAGLTSLFGGSVAWWINRKVHKNRARSFLIIAITFSFLFPSLITSFIDLILTQNIVWSFPGFVRARIAPPGTSPGSLILIYVVVSVLASYLSLRSIKSEARTENA